MSPSVIRKGFDRLLAPGYAGKAKTLLHGGR
jgi:hypothetical protein